jgi:peptide/nickel transport system substrate-binding protein
LSNIEVNLVAETLVGIAWDGRPTPKLAAEWEWLPNRLGLRLKLHPSVRFHDGTPLDADLARTLLSGAISRATPGTFISLGSLARIDAEDSRTLVLHLSKPEAFLPADLASLAIEHLQDRLLGTGPYRRLTADEIAPTADGSSRDLVRLTAFNDYYRGRPEIDFVELRRYEEQRSAWAALMRGNIDAVHEVSPSALDFVEAQTTVNTFSFTRPYFVQLMFNMRHPVLKQVRVRRALSHAVDRQQLVDVALNGRGVAAEGPVWPMHWAHSTARAAYTLNREAATLMLDSAGFRTAKRRPGAMPSRFRFTCLTLANEARFEKIASLLQKQLHDIGVDMEVEALPLRELGSRLANGRFDALLLERSSGRSLAWTYMTFHSSMAPNGYRSADGVLDRLRRARSDEETRVAVSDLQKILHDDPPALFLMWPIVARAVSNRFVVPGEAGRDVMGSLWQWRPAQP